MFNTRAAILKNCAIGLEFFVTGREKLFSKCVPKKPWNRCPKLAWWRSGFKTAFGKYLMLTNTLISGGMMSLGDLIQQEIKYYREDKPNSSFDWKRNKNMALIGLAQGPFMHVFYSAMDKYIPGATYKSVLKKVFLDQTVGSPILISTFFIGVGYLGGQKFDDIMKELKKKFMFVYIIDCIIWIPVQFINFFWLSNKYRVVYVNLVVMCYNTFLSFMKFDI